MPRENNRTVLKPFRVTVSSLASDLQTSVPNRRKLPMFVCLLDSRKEDAHYPWAGRAAAEDSNMISWPK